MRDGKFVLTYIRNHYVVSYVNIPGSNSKILLRDTFEDKKDGRILQITQINGVDVEFIWNKIKKIIGLDLQHKDFPNLASLILTTFKEPKCLSFYKFLVDEKVNVTIPLNEVPEEFPQLFKNQKDSRFNSSSPDSSII